MGKLKLGKNKRTMALFIGLLLIALATVGSLKFFILKEKIEEPAPTSEGDTRQRLDFSPQEIVDLAPDPAYAYTQLYATADSAERKGDMDQAERYLLEAVNQAKLTEDQEKIDGSYRFLIGFYKRQENKPKLDELKTTLGEEKYTTIATPEEVRYQ